MKKLIVTLAAAITMASGNFLAAAVVPPAAVTVAPDPGFGTAGVVTDYQLDSVIGATSAVPTADNKIIGTGPNSLGYWVVARLLPTGTLDNTFGSNWAWLGYDVNAWVALDLPGNAYDLAIMSDGLLVAGVSNNKATLVKLNPNGTGYVSGFGSNNKVEIPSPNSSPLELRKVLVGSNSITVLGVTLDGTKLRVARLKNNGQLDNSFGFGGITDINLSLTNSTNVKPLVNAAQDSSGWVYTMAGNDQVAYGVKSQLNRLSPNGAIDPNYGGLVGPTMYGGQGLVLLPDGRSATSMVDLAAGSAVLQVFDASGLPVTKTAIPVVALEFPSGLTRWNDKLVMATRGSASNSRIHLIGFNLDGTLATEFGTSGSYSYTNSSASFVKPNGILSDQSGRLVVPGVFKPNKPSNCPANPPADNKLCNPTNDVAVYRFKVTTAMDPVPTPTPTVAGPVVVRPSVQLGSPAMVKAKSFTSITGTAAGTKVSSVQVSVRRIDKKKEKKGVCFFLGATGRMQPFRAPAKSCAGPLVAINATGTKSWMVGVAPKAKPGKYVVSARAIGSGGTSAWATQTITVKK